MLFFIRVAMVMVSLHSNRKYNEDRRNTKDWGVAVISLTMLFKRNMDAG